MTKDQSNETSSFAPRVEHQIEFQRFRDVGFSGLGHGDERHPNKTPKQKEAFSYRFRTRWVLAVWGSGFPIHSTLPECCGSQEVSVVWAVGLDLF